MTSCKEYPFSIHIEILLIMTQINKVFAILISFSTVVKEIDLIHNWEVFFKVMNKDSLYFIRNETKKIVLNISITVNKTYNECVWCAVFVAPMVNLDFILQKELAKSPRTVSSFSFRDSFLVLRKLAWHLAKKECFVWHLLLIWKCPYILHRLMWQRSSVCSLPLWVMKLKITISVTELLFMKFT